MTDDSDRKPEESAELSELMRSVKQSSTSMSRYREVEDWYATLLELESTDVRVTFISGKKQFSPRLKTPGIIGPDHPELVVADLGSADLLESAMRWGRRVTQLDEYAEVLAVQVPTGVGWTVGGIVMVDSSALGERLRDRFPGVTVETVEKARKEPPIRRKARQLALQLSDRVHRMVRLGLSSAPSVMLVGPPGTGKTTIIEDLIDEVATDPDALGFGSACDAIWVTPDDTWTARELVGGETLDDRGRIRFQLGAVLDAIRVSKWLVLDEANRADMDKIFGPLLTWLTGKRVVVGRLSPKVDAPEIVLDWHDGRDCFVDGIERLDAEDPGSEPIVFKAGTDWRLLGTYNAVDAHRVFRFGQALGRRFVRVPVPPMSPDEFGRAIQTLSEGLPEDFTPAITQLYAAHYHSSSARLGPAVFLRMPDYLRAAMDADDEPTTGRLQEYLAEAYLLAVGAFLAILEPHELDELASQIELPDEEWDWIQSLVPSLA